uniref:Uncharacterized protein n=1 Tax=Leersia perrieri TaxID=77586 RepID=A0A0D9VV14_9ORYZ
MSSKICSVISGLVSRQCVRVRAVSTRASVDAAAGQRMNAATPPVIMAVKKEVSWMRDPKTGCWAPENRPEELDAVDLRNRLLNYKPLIDH